MTGNKKINVFFSWQSDLDAALTTRAIKKALNDVAFAMGDVDIDVKIIEATSNSPGSPYIPGEIARKIHKSDVFVADITPITESTASKKCPNPNVTFELGLAVAHLGWDRIVMLIHTDFSDLKGLPFDFDRHRISNFRVRSDQNNKNDIKKLTQLLNTALQAIIEQNPKRPRDLEAKSESEIRRERDLRNIQWFMNNMNTSALDMHIEEMPGYLNTEAIHISDGLTGVVTSSEFHLYDKELELAMRDLQAQLEITVSYDHFYSQSLSGLRSSFGSQHYDLAAERREKEVFKNISSACILMKDALKNILSLLRENYIEVDIASTNAVSRRQFCDAHRELIEK